MNLFNFSFDRIIQNFFNSIHLFIFGDNRLSLKPLTLYVIFVVIFYFLSKNKKKISIQDIIRFVFPRNICLHPSFKMDLKVSLIRLIFNPVNFIAFSAFATSIAINISNFLIINIPKYTGKMDANQTNLFLISLCGFLCLDLSQYIGHRMFHKISFLWPFHSPHHSAEVLTPFTTGRDHFLWNIFENFFLQLFMGVGQGIFIWAGDAYINPHQIFMYSLIFNFFNYLLGNLHHSHIWLSFGWLDRIFISPALHQIHHSIDLKHRNKNYGLFLSIWDQIFGTIYVPKEKEKLTYGLNKDLKNPHNSLFKFYFLPFKESFLIIKKKFENIFSFKNTQVLNKKIS